MGATHDTLFTRSVISAVLAGGAECRRALIAIDLAGDPGRHHFAFDFFRQRAAPALIATALRSVGVASRPGFSQTQQIAAFRALTPVRLQAQGLEPIGRGKTVAVRSHGRLAPRRLKLTFAEPQNHPNGDRRPAKLGTAQRLSRQASLPGDVYDNHTDARWVRQGWCRGGGEGRSSTDQVTGSTEAETPL